MHVQELLPTYIHEIDNESDFGKCACDEHVSQLALFDCLSLVGGVWGPFINARDTHVSKPYIVALSERHVYHARMQEWLGRLGRLTISAQPAHDKRSPNKTIRAWSDYNTNSYANKTTWGRSLTSLTRYRDYIREQS